MIEDSVDSLTPVDDVIVLDVRNLGVSFATEGGSLNVVRDVSLRIRRGEIYGLVGESGSGKTTLARAVVKYLPRNGRVNAGSILLNGVDLLSLSARDMRAVWGAKITMVHQDPSSSVNPSIPVGEQVAEVARTHLGMSRSRAWERALELLSRVQLPDPESVAKRYSHQLSGGMLQRVLIAAALVTNPELLIMDEPTTSLDVTTEAAILDLIRDLLEGYRTAVLYITHNLGVIAQLCHRVGVMYSGQMVEEGPIEGVFKHPLFPYTQGLMGCVPRVDMRRRDIRLNTIPGYIPRPDNLPSGCVFAPRCPIVEDKCRQARPPVVEPQPGHSTACRRWTEMKPNVELFEASEAQVGRLGKLGSDTALEARNLKKHFRAGSQWLGSLYKKETQIIRALDDVSLKVPSGSTIGIVGESGCGKTTLARCLVGLEEATSGEVQIEGRKVARSWARRDVETLRKIQIVFQNPDASLNPQHSVGGAIGRPLVLKGGLSKAEVGRRVRQLLQAVRLPEEFLSRFPYELSGGEKQRVAIARAFAADPRIVVCDEPVSSLDVSVQASLMNLLADLQRMRGTTYLFISHDLAAVRYLSDGIAVMYLGHVVEIGPADQVFVAPQHPYTEALFSAIPIPDPLVQKDRVRLEGGVPSAIHIPSGCRFHTRCPRKIGAICEKEEPIWQAASEGHMILCHIAARQLLELQEGGGGPTRISASSSS